MKINSLVRTAIFLFLHTCMSAQAILQIGEPLISDTGNDLLFAADGSFVTCGSKGNKAVLYKSDCAGNLVAQIEKPYLPGPGRFFDTVQLPDGSLVTVGSATIATLGDTLERVLLLKTSSDLTEISAANFLISGKTARAKSITLSSNGDLLVLGEVTGDFPNLSDMFLLRVDQTSLLPVFNPAIYNYVNGVDMATEIISTADGNCLLIGSSFLGNIFDPNAMIVNRLIVMKTTENGPLLWSYAYLDTFPAQYGPALAGGVEQNAVSGNFMFAGATYGGSPEMHQDALFLLLDNNGNLLDSALLQAPMRQGIAGLAAYSDATGLYIAAGDSDNPVLGTPGLLAAQAYEQGGQIIQTYLINDPANPLAIEDIIEIGQNRIAIIAGIPDNPTVLGSKDILIATPQIDNIDILYQNCALVASFSAADPTYQWYFNDTPIPGATTGVHFPTQSGVYQVRITDNIGCFGVSDTLTVTQVSAGFDVETDHLTATFTNTSVSATAWFWDFGDGQTSSLANPQHDYAVGGTYMVTLIATSPCGADTSMQTIGLVNAGEPAWIDHFRLFPNPNGGIFSVEIEGTGQSELDFAFFNSTGQLLNRQSLDFRTGRLQHTFNFADVPPGVYTLQMQAPGGVKYVKVMVSR